MALDDSFKVWKIETLKHKPKEEEARKFLEKIAKEVQPIMRKHKWRVLLLSEFWPESRSLRGRNHRRGIHVMLRLRRWDKDDVFLPYHQVLNTMLHELCHNVRSPHDATFFSLLAQLKKEYNHLITNKNKLGGDTSVMAAMTPAQAAAMAAERRLQNNIRGEIAIYDDVKVKSEKRRREPPFVSMKNPKKAKRKSSSWSFEFAMTLTLEG